MRLTTILTVAIALCLVALPVTGQTVNTQTSEKPGCPLVTALWFSHSHGMSRALSAGNDRQLKVNLVAALRGISAGLSWDAV
jgi:hypothetical protein